MSKITTTLKVLALVILAVAAAALVIAIAKRVRTPGYRPRPVPDDEYNPAVLAGQLHTAFYQDTYYAAGGDIRAERNAALMALLVLPNTEFRATLLEWGRMLRGAGATPNPRQWIEDSFFGRDDLKQQVINRMNQLGI